MSSDCLACESTSTRVERISEGLWRWTGLHPDWQEGEAWPQEVSCVYYEAPDHVVLIDPLVPPEARDEFLEALDRDVERVGRPVAIIHTTESHVRSTEELRERYSAAVGGALPGVEAVATDRYGELAFWIPEHRTVVFGDVIVGGPVFASWVNDGDREKVRAALAPLLEQPIERVIATHGEPTLASGREALAQALQAK